MFKKISENEFCEVFEIMEESFPKDERRPYNKQKELLKNSNYEIYIEKEDNINGFSAIWEFDDFLFLEHLAVRKEFRKKGIGTKILAELKSLFGKRICLEVEPPTDEVKKKRIDFYERNGFFLNMFEYVQPALSEGRKPVKLLIMTTEAPLGEDEFKRIVDILYRKVYKVSE